jgi:transposase
MAEATREQLKAQIEALRAQGAAQAAQGAAQAVEIECLRGVVADLEGVVADLRGVVADLEARVGKSSKNSSLPPSSDSPKDRAEATTTRAQRRAQAKEQRRDELTRRRGKQRGAPGQNLAMAEHPDEVIEHEPTNCTFCGESLCGASSEGFEGRQVFDTPRPVLTSVEHRALSKRCVCGQLTKGTFPKEATAPACYGPNVRASALYLLFGQHLSVERTAEALSALLGADVSTGFVASLATEAAGGLVGFMNEIRRRLASSAVVCADETSDQVRTETWWFHVASNELYTYLFASPSRGKSAPDEAGVLGSFGGVLMHDRLAMYFKYEQSTHAICGAHLLRDLAAVAADVEQGWALEMKDLLTEMNTAAHGARALGLPALSAEELAAFMSRYDAIVAAGLAATTEPKGRTRYKTERDASNLAWALKKLRAEATRFASDLVVPFTNNEAERSLRMAKLHRKISGCFQSDEGARAFATIRSYLATARKHNVGALDVLAQLFGGEAWMPPRTT